MHIEEQEEEFEEVIEQEIDSADNVVEGHKETEEASIAIQIAETRDLGENQEGKGEKVTIEKEPNEIVKETKEDDSNDTQPERTEFEQRVDESEERETANGSKDQVKTPSNHTEEVKGKIMSSDHHDTESKLFAQDIPVTFD